MANRNSNSHEYRVVELEACARTSDSPFPSNQITTTKYTLWNFVPKNLFEQFRRVGNFYFLASSIIATVIETPISPWTSWTPLVFVILITAIKQAFEDFKRYKSDRRLNNQLITVIRRTGVQKIHCKEIVVGDIIRVNRDDEVPCDLVILHSSESTGKCYVTTSNLDGETNLKILQVPKMFADLEEIHEIVAMKGTIMCQPPVAGLYKFEGRAQVSIPQEDKVIKRSGPLTIENLALRGARLKDTDHILGCAIYTGRDSKLSLNSKLKLRKTSIADKSINKFLWFFLVMLFIEVALCVAAKFKIESTAKWNAYLGEYIDSKESYIANLVLSFIILYNYILPISLYVTLEMQKFLGSYTFNWDLKMYDELTDQPALANTSELNENLGQIEYLFSDKTGTLTDNMMIFRRCFINGNSYMEKDCDGKLYLLPPDGSDANSERISNWTREIWQFMLGMSLCHDVHIAPPSQKAKAKMQRIEFRASFRSKRIYRLNSSLMMDPDLPEYEAASVDEKSLVEASARLGVIFLGNKEGNELEVNLKGTIMRLRRLEILEFTSERKRMSVVIEDSAGDIRLYCKGADSSIFPLIKEGNNEPAKAAVKDFSMRGLRTLVYGFKKLTKDEYIQLTNKINDARQSMGPDRIKNIDEAYIELEDNLQLLGVSGLEDRLQECVPETMEKLRAAGIKIWVLTGDKAETAENIAFSCGHFKKGTNVMRLMGLNSSQTCFVNLTSFERKIKIEPYIQRGLLIDGVSLGIALKTCPGLLRNVAMACEGVVCCRMSPLQKSEIVQLVKRAPSKPMTAAIGDGGNDVSMIKEAHVGLGITGKEGRQAAMNADYAFSKFMHLQRALLVHGHWYYLRVSVLVMYFFYKNIVFITPQLFFSLHNGFSAQALYDGLFLMSYNTFFSSVPIILYGIYEQNYSDDKLLERPILYQLYRNNYLMSAGQFVLWMFLAFWQSCAIYFVTWGYLRCNPIIMHDNTPAEQSAFATCIMHLVTLTINLQLLIVSSYWTIPFVASIVFTELLFFGVTLLYSILNHFFDGAMLVVFPKLLLSPTFWLLTILVVAVCLIPAMLIVVWQNRRPARLRGTLESREDNISDVIYSTYEQNSNTLPNQKSSMHIFSRKHMTI